MIDSAETPPDTLWHYTDFKGLQGILKGTLWASSVAFLNDSQEFSYALNVAQEVLAEDDVRSEITAVYSSNLDKVAETLDDIFALEGGTSVFASSLSTKFDDLSQWRAYGGAGPSMSVGFNAPRLKAVAADVGFELVRVEYDREEIAEAFRAMLRRYYGTGGHGSPKTKPRAFQPVDFTIEVLIPLLDLAAKAKDASFQAECEWRLVSRLGVPTKVKPTLPVQFRQSGSLVVPYVEIPLQRDSAIPASGSHSGKSVIRSVVIGPSPHPKRLKYAVEQMLKSKAEVVEVESSAVPFRNW
jgi:hypothetical protein